MKKTVDNELEHLLRTSADEIRLRPSPKVWKGINSRLQRRKRTYRAAMLLLLLIGLTVGVYITNTNGDKSTSVAGIQNTSGNNPEANKPLAGNNNNAAIPVNTATSGSLASAPVQNVQAMDINDDPAATPTRSKHGTIRPVVETATVPGDDIIIAGNEPQPATGISELQNVVIKNDLGAVANPAENNNKEEGTTDKQSSSSFTKLQNNGEENNTANTAENNNEKLTAESRNPSKTNPAKEMQINKPEELPVKDIADATIRITTKPRRFTTEFYAMPSISYRKLVDSRDPNAAGANSKEDFDKAVYHKPSLGLEAGVSWHYRIYDRFRAKAGLQLNYNRFNMKATYAPQQETARIVLYGNGQVENQSSYRTGNDHGLVEWLRNKNLQISVPIGFEVAVTAPSKGNTTLNIGTTLQPSYLLGNKNYLLSTDLKNYTTEPSLVRRFNMNLGFETFFAFETKKLRWHMGPQLRYQLFSTYNKIYPYKENLIDYTFKISVSKPF